MARFFALMVEGLLVRAASRYKLNRARNLSPVIEVGFEPERDRGIKHLRSIQVQEQGAKNVTSLFILPALLVEVAVNKIVIKEQDLS